METNELNRLLNNLCRVCTIAELDLTNKKVKVSTGELTTAWLNWPADVGRNYARFKPLRLNTQVILLSPSGDISQGYIVGEIYSQADTPPQAAAEEKDIIEFTDGTTIMYDINESLLIFDCVGATTINCTDANVSASKNATVTAKGNATVEAKKNATVKAGVNAKVEAGGEANVKGETVKLQDGVAGGVVCQSHVCSFTGGPHPQASITVTAGN